MLPSQPVRGQSSSAGQPEPTVSGIFNVESFLPYYPAPDDPDLIMWLTTSREFADNAIPVTESTPGVQGELLSQQRLVKRFMSPYTPYAKLLLFHHVGVGKCMHPHTRVRLLYGEERESTIITLESLWNSCKSEPDSDVSNVGEWKSVEGVGVGVLSKLGDSYTRCTVSKLYRQHIRELVKCIRTESGTIQCTLSHKVYLYDKGWTSSVDRFDRLQAYSDGKAAHETVLQVSYEWYEGYVYDLQVDKSSNYHCLLNNSVELLVHNTCSAIAVGESFKNTLVQGAKRSRVLILVTNKLLKEQFTRAIYATCTLIGEYYASRTFKIKGGEGVVSDKTFAERLKKQVNKTYEIATHETFLKRISLGSESNTDTASWIRRNYSNRTIIVDEVHRLRQHASKTDFYARLLLFLTHVQDCRVLLMSGTPIWESPWELSSVMNLLLPPTQRLPSESAFMRRYFRGGVLVNEQELIDAWKGKISFLRPVMSTARRIEMGVTEPFTRYTRVYPTVMERYQQKVSLDVETGTQQVTIKRGETTFVKEVEGGAWLKGARDVMNLVYPELTPKGPVYGTDALAQLEATVQRRSLRGRRGGGQAPLVSQVQYVLPDLLKRAFGPVQGFEPGQPGRYGSLRQYSCKFATIIQLIEANPRENAFVYNEEVAEGGGCIVFALILELYGFRKATAGFVISNTTAIHKRYIILTSNSSTLNDDVQIDRALQSFNNPRNRYGDYIRVVIGSKKISEGITFKCVRQMHVVMPLWNRPSLEQGEGRVFRFGSHDALPEDERYVKIYRHIAIYAEGTVDQDTVSTDVYVAERAEAKEGENVQLYRLAKRIDPFCALSYARNVLEIDTDGSRACDLRECNYECYGVPPTDVSSRVWKYDYPVNDNNYNILYSYQDALGLLQNITPIFRYRDSIGFDALYEILQRDRPGLVPFVLLSALDLILNSRLTIRNRMGFPCYLKEEGDVYFLTTFVETDNYPLSVYTSSPITCAINPMSSIVHLLRDTQGEERMCIFGNSPSITTLYALSFPQRILILEWAYSTSALGQTTQASLPVVALVLQELGGNLYKVEFQDKAVQSAPAPKTPTPTEEAIEQEIDEEGLFDQMAAELLEVEAVQGETEQEMALVEEQIVQQDAQAAALSNDNNVYHIQYMEEYTDQSYDILVRKYSTVGLTRQWSSAQQQWSWVTDIAKEKTILKSIKQQTEARQDALFAEAGFPFYGLLARDGKFRVRRQEVRKQRTRGRDCDTSDKIQLLEYLAALGYLPPAATVGKGKAAVDPSTLSRQELLDKVQEFPLRQLAAFTNYDQYSQPRLAQLYTLLSITKYGLCSIVLTAFLEGGVLFDETGKRLNPEHVQAILEWRKL